MRLIDAYKLAYRYWDEIGCKCVLDQEIEDAPTVDALPVMHAHWENIGGGHAECSNCGMTVSADYPASPSVHYCAKCGAKMDGKGKYERD